MKTGTWCDGTSRSARCIAVAWVAAAMGLVASAEEVRFDFETGDLQGWVVAEGAFDQAVSSRPQSRNTPGTPYPKQGDYYLSTTERADGGFDDGMRGILESPVFLLEGSTVSLQVGGGMHPDTYVALCLEDGTELYRASGSNSETMRPVEWDVSEYAGERVFVQVVDRNTGGWGHVTLDDVRAQGRIDEEATARLRTTFAAREAGRTMREGEAAARQAERREKRRTAMLDERRLFGRGEARVYRGEHLAAIAMPVGGIASGCILMDGHGRAARWQIFNRHTPAVLPHSFFAVRAAAPGQPAVTRALQTEAAGPFAPMESLEFTGEYPIGRYRFADSQLPVQATLEVLNPLIPLNVRDSAFPCAVFLLTAENAGPDAVDVSFLGLQQNAVGYPGEGEIDGRTHAGYGGNRNTVVREGGAVLVHMTSNAPADAPGAGDMGLMALAEEGQGAAAWDDIDALHRAFAQDGAVAGPDGAGPSAPGRTLDGALAVPFRLEPGRSRTVAFVLAWHFPNAVHGQGDWGGSGNRYAAWWPDARAVLRELRDRLPELVEATHRYHDALYDSNLPRWMVDRISSQVAILRTPTCFWTRDGYFGGWEGCGVNTGCCLGNCGHVWHYAQAHARLFPELARRMREQDHAHQAQDGGIPHRHIADAEPATDGQLGSILATWREHLMSPDAAWLHEQWPHAKKAMDYVIGKWDADEDGVLGGRQWNTLDDALGGNTSWMGSLYLAALAACERMAVLEGDGAVADRYGRIRASGMPKQDQTLFNGEYYIQVPDPEPRKDYNNGCHIDQVLGQWWAHQLGLGGIYPEERVRTALRSLFRYNFRPDFHGIPQVPRKFVADQDAGTQMITWPHGGRPDPDHCIYYGDEVMTGFEYAAAAAMIQAGLLQEGFAVVRAVADRYDGRTRTGLTPGDTASWGYSGNPFGDDECGKFYARAMSSWSLLTACQGLEYDGPAGLLAFAPVWQPDDHASFFTGAEGWGLFTQRRHQGRQENRIDLRHGSLRLATLRVETPLRAADAAVEVRLGGNPVAAAVSTGEGRVALRFDPPLTLRAGDVLEARMSAMEARP